MIARILGEGQWQVPEELLEPMNALDAAVEQAIMMGDERAFAAALTALLDVVRQQGTRLEDDSLVESDVILPMADASLEEVRALLTDEGLVPD